MKRLRKALAIGTTLVALATSARADDVKVNASSSLQSGQVTGTGFTIVDNAVVQGSLDVSKDPFSIGTWFSYDTKEREITEIDLTTHLEVGDYAGIHAQLYGGYFTLPGLQVPDAQELGLTLSTTALPIDLSLYGAKIFGNESGKGGYASVTLGKTLPLSENVSLAGSATLGYNDHYFTKSRGISHGVIDLSLPVTLGDFTITPALKFLGTDPFNKFPGIFKDKIAGGITLETEF